MRDINIRTKVVLKLCCIILGIFQINDVLAWEGMPMPPLHVEGRYLKDPHGNIVNLHGYAQTFSPWFNERGTKWNNYDVNGCLTYNKDIIDRIIAAGWKMNFVRMHMDPYWSNTPGCEGRYEGEECFNETRFLKYLDEVFVPMAEYAVSKGLYVIFRPPGVSPEKIQVGGIYHEYLLNVWGIVSNHPKLKNHPNIMFELANEPVHILGPDGTFGANSQGHFDNLKTYFQAIVDTIRNNADNILWIPGLGYQSQYHGFAVNPIEGKNIGYAVHVYPGWFNSGQGYEPFQRGWNEQVQPVADFAPVVVTEMDWAPEKYNASWGKDVTGIAGGEGFGANFKKITDDAGNVSWLLFTEPHFLAVFSNVPPAEGEAYTFLTDPEACPWPIYHWYLEYAQKHYPRADFEFRSSSDNGNGTFANPVISADFPAPVLIRDGDTYYMVSTNTIYNPSYTILESKDLVNWEYSGKNREDISIDNALFVDNSDIHSGTLVETQTGEWWVMISYDKGPFGKFPHLLPVTWINGSPIIDESAKNAAYLVKPDVERDHSPKYLITNDNFRYYRLGNQWAWSGNSDQTYWSLLDRPGFIRLKTGQLIDGFENNPTLTQRIFAYPDDPAHSYGTIRMELSQMLDGDVAGLAIFQADYGFIGIEAIGGEKKLVVVSNGVKTETGTSLTGSDIYLRIVANYNTGQAIFYYSVDNSTYTQIGSEINMNALANSGCRFGIFNYATTETGGFVDIDWFSTESSFSEEEFYPTNFEAYTEESLTLTDFIVNGDGELITVLTKGITKINVQAVFADGHTENISTIAEYNNHNPDVIRVSRGHIVSLKDGKATLDISYTAPLGELKQATVQISSTTFPLTNTLFNPDIWENGSFDETTKTLHTGPWGFGGWRYDGVDLSDYKYIVARLGSDNYASVDFRLFDGSSYWGSPASYSFGNSREIVVILDRAVKGDGKPLNPEHIYIAGFWSNGSAPFIIDTVFFSNSSEYDPPTVYATDLSGTDMAKLEGFNYLEGTGPSANQTFIVSGEVLTDNILIESSLDFEVSMDESQGYSKSKNLLQTDGHVAGTTIYVRLKSGLSKGNYTGMINISSSEALTKTIALSGTVDQVTAIDHRPKSNATVVSIWYYTVTGQKIQDLENRSGFYIVRKLFSDGTFSSEKIFKVN